MFMKEGTEKFRPGTCKFNKSYHETLVQVCVHVPPFFKAFTKGTDKVYHFYLDIGFQRNRKLPSSNLQQLKIHNLKIQQTY